MRIKSSVNLVSGVALVAALGCTSAPNAGSSTARGGSGGSDPPPTFDGVPSQPPPGTLPVPAATAVETPMRRLSATQYGNALQALARRALPKDGDEVASSILALLRQAVYPPDALKDLEGARHGGISRTDQAMQQVHVDASYAIALALARDLTASEERLVQLLGPCRNGGNAETCLTSFIERFGRLVLRRPLDSSDVDFYRSIADPTPGDATGIANVIALLLTAPEFLYQLEIGVPTDVSGRTKLTAHEVAARLALHFWDSVPDEELERVADDGSLANDEVYAAEVARLVGDSRADSVVRAFFSEWFRLQDTPELQARLGDATYRAVAGSFMPTADTREELNLELADLVNLIYREGGTLKDVLLDNRNVARAPGVASLYGLAAWDGTSAPVAMPGRNLITRIAFLASGLTHTSPIMKGVRSMNGLLCQSLPPPPPAAMNVVVELSPDLTTREVVEGLTQQPGSSCRGCHEAIINPLGFVTEGFDPFGRLRSAEQLFDKDGNPTLARPVRTDGVIHLTAGDPGNAANADDAVGMIAASGLFEACFARTYFRFVFGRKEQDFDTHVLSQLAYDAAQGKGLPSVMQAVALRPEFRLRMSR